MNIYLAGKIGFKDWRFDIVQNLYDVDPQDERFANAWPVITNSIFNTYNYSGPFFIYDNHGLSFDPNSHGVAIDCCCCGVDGLTRPRTAMLCRKAIQNSDLVFAWFGKGDTDAYGTITELGYAKAIGKQVRIAGFEHNPDMWFVYEFCSSQKPMFGFENAKDALHVTLIDYLRWMPYKEYLQTPHWKSVRQVSLERAQQRCQVCNTNKALQVHHRTYERRGMELPEDLIVLCADCHRVFHENGKLAKAEVR